MPVLFLKASGGLGRLVAPDAEERGRRARRAVGPRVVFERAPARGEGHAHEPLRALPLPRDEAPDLAGRAGVRPAAGAEVEALDLDDAQLALTRRVFAERHLRRLLGRDEVHAHGAV